MQTNDIELEYKWEQLGKRLKTVTNKVPDMNAILFLIGVQELGQGARNYTKEQKQDLMHIAVCRLLEPLGYYELESQDADGWPHYKLCKALPQFDLLSQEKLLKMQVLEYFEHIL
jgi:hypothetical protein